MNFKILIYLGTLLSLFGCGVKSAPTAPPDTQIPSYVEKFLDGAPAPATSSSVTEPARKIPPCWDVPGSSCQ